MTTTECCTRPPRWHTESTQSAPPPTTPPQLQAETHSYDLADIPAMKEKINLFIWKKKVYHSLLNK